MHKYIHTYIQSLIPPREDQCEWHRMTRMTGPDCVVMCNLINTYIHTYIHTYTVTRNRFFSINQCNNGAGSWSTASTKVLNCSQGQAFRLSLPIRYKLRKGVRYVNFEKYFLLRVWSRPAEGGSWGGDMSENNIISGCGKERRMLIGP